MSVIRGREAEISGRTEISSFEDLEVFKRAYRISLGVHRASFEFLTSSNMLWRIKSAARVNPSVRTWCSNLAEGFGKQPHSTAEFRRFIGMALGSADENANVSSILSRPRICRRSDLGVLA